MDWNRWTWLSGVRVAAASWVCLMSAEPPPSWALAGPVAQIVEPRNGLKLRQGSSIPIRIRVDSRQYPLWEWTLVLKGSSGTNRTVAIGDQIVDDRPVAELAADALTPGEPYELLLEADDVNGTHAGDRLDVLVPDPQYALIPLEPGNRLGHMFAGLSMDASGDLVAFGGASPHEVRFANAATGVFSQTPAPIASSEGFHLTADGQRFYFNGNFISDTGTLNLASLSLGDLADIIRGPVTNSASFSVDGTGRRIAFQSSADLDPHGSDPNGALQYFWYDDLTKEIRQLTNDPHAVDYDVNCPRLLGTTPLISIDGQTVVFATSATLGLLPADPTSGCHIFAYDAPSRVLRHVLALPKATQSLDATVLSYDGYWLSFIFIRDVPPYGVPRTFGALLDVRLGQLSDMLVGAADFPTFDAVITGDASALVLSSEADLDPRVGNADHNMELFLFDRATGEYTQISETVGGVGRFPGGCESYLPAVSADGHAVAFSFALFSIEPCRLDGPQRNEADGFTFGLVRAVRKRTGNHPPLLTPTGDVRVLIPTALTVELTATDPDGDPMTYFAQMPGTIELPAGSRLEDHHDGTATFVWPTTPDSVGTYRVRVAVFDEGGGEAVQDFSIAACPRIVAADGLTGVMHALFDSTLPVSCSQADLNRDGIVSAADLVQALRD
jgi:hypothetical protein